MYPGNPVSNDKLQKSVLTNPPVLLSYSATPMLAHVSFLNENHDVSDADIRGR